VSGRSAIVRPCCILLDSQALSALGADDRLMQPWVAFARRTDSTLHASTVTLAEVTDGSSRDANVRRVGKAVRLHDVTPEIGYHAGELRATASSSTRRLRDLTVAAIVAATALTLLGRVVVLTCDDSDLRLLLDGTAIRIERIG
jgi:predicted nucleic acid-binding protein